MLIVVQDPGKCTHGTGGRRGLVERKRTAAVLHSSVLRQPFPPMSNRDSIFARPMNRIADFAFDESVANVFPDMIQRSVPGYTTIIANTGLLAGRYAATDSNCYDLGCSLGASSLAMQRQIDAPNCKIIGIDNSPAMLQRCQEAMHLSQGNTAVEWRLEDIRESRLEKASVVVLNFTLQFLPLEERDDLITRIAANMLPGGILIVSEKIRFEDPHVQSLMTDMHHDFKRANGYSDLEIAQKRDAIENVLLPETLETHRQRMHRAGFSSFDNWFQCFNFASMVAIR